MNDLAMLVIIPPMTILPLVLTAALYNYWAKNAPGSIWTPPSVQDGRYKLDNLGTFKLSFRAKKQQARIR